jgi:hypothetical protein
VSQEISPDAVVEANRELLLQRSKVGIAKYGVTLQNSGLGRRAILQHALEEALDLANYLQTEIMRLDAAAKAREPSPLCRICEVRPKMAGFDHCGGPECIPY